MLIDIPVGPTAKVRSVEAAQELGTMLEHVGEAVGLHLRVLQTDGSQPVGRGIGPALEARDLVAVLQRDTRAPTDLRERALLLAGHLLELGGRADEGSGYALAQQALDSGRAWSQFVAICEAQGGMRAPPKAPHVLPYVAEAAGTITGVDNRKLAMVAKLCGAPASPAAGITVEVKLGERVQRGQPLLHLHAATMGELEYARAYASGQTLITIGETP